MKRIEKICEKFKAECLKKDKTNGCERYMTKVITAEKAERISLNLEGNQAIKHYNKWMIAAGLDHLMIKE